VERWCPATTAILPLFVVLFDQHGGGEPGQVVAAGAAHRVSGA
jgi:hypothetical protein